MLFRSNGPNLDCAGANAGGGRGGAANVAGPGSYVATLTVGGKTYTKPVTVLEDKWMSPR